MCIFIVIWESYARLFDHHGQQPGKQKKDIESHRPSGPHSLWRQQCSSRAGSCGVVWGRAGSCRAGEN
jgi:hypothetical protein